MFEERLVRMINSGNCLALVGAGLSREIGYPDWGQLATQTVEKLKETVDTIDEDSYSRYLEHRKYPELFSQAERDLGSREKLEGVVSELLTFTPATLGAAYKQICKSPFACYLTTNFDNELQRHLRELSVEFTIADNTPSSLANLRTDTRDVIFKLHSDFTLPGKPTLTSADYQELYASGGGGYYRDCLKAVFQKFDLLIIGYSLADPDMSYILDLAKEGASPAHPIYMIGPDDDLSDADASEFRERYNIRLLRYANDDGCHRQLRRTLETYDCFIQPRNTPFAQRAITREEVEESLDALSLYLHRKLSPDFVDQAIAPLVLSELHKAAPHDRSAKELTEGALHALLSRVPDALSIVEDALEALCRTSDVEEGSNRYRLSDAGKRKHDQVVFDGRGMKERAFGQFRLALRQYCANVAECQEHQACSALESAITTAFSRHSSAIVNAILSDADTAAHEGMALFRDIHDAAQGALKRNVFNAYMMASCDFLFAPQEDQKQFLASLSHGFFLAHLLGQDPHLRKIQGETLQEAAWLVDSSILIPLVAKGSALSDFAASLFLNLKKLGVFVFTTDKLVQEVWRHFEWARTHIKRSGVQEDDALYSCIMSDRNTLNLFLEGYASFAVQEGLEHFDEYVSTCFGDSPDIAVVEERLGEYGIVTVNPIGHVSSTDELDGWKREISKTRKERQTWRSEFQIEVEAEAYWAIENYGPIVRARGKDGVLRAYFVSHSNVLNEVAGKNVTWLPESLFRYLSGLSGVELDDNVMQQCVLDSISASRPFIDRRKFLEVFGKRIDIAKLDFDKEKQRYIETIERANLRDLEEAFETTPSIEKPLFMSQMGWEMARVEEQKRAAAQSQRDRAADKLEDAQKRIRQLEQERDAGWKRKQAEFEKQEAARRRNLQDPKHVRKRRRQEKNRKRKKK